MRRLMILLTCMCFAIPASPTLADDPLPSWKPGPTRDAVVEFVRRVTDPNGPDFVPPAERIATFDNDGTLWSEQPIYFQLAFAIDRVKQLAPQHPEWKRQQPFKAVLENDRNAITAAGKEGLVKLIMASHAGMTTEQFAKIAREWLATARHPLLKRRYKELVYQPMLELLGYLRENGFRTYIVSGGGVEFLRAFAEEVYGIPPHQVVGSTIKTKFEIRGGRPVIVRLPEIDFVDDKAGKPVAINKFIGRRPIAAFGNSDGDLQMLQWTAGRKGASFCMIVHHTDEKREWAYDRQSSVGHLAKALDEAKRRGWTVANMKEDWTTIYPATHHYLHKKSRPHLADWGYSGPRGPAHWGDLHADYLMAKTGKQQSPIDIRLAVPKSLPALGFNYKPSRIRLVYDGHTIKEREDPGSFGMARGKRFELQQFHFHAPSEHTVDGNHFPAEMHLVHKAQDGTIGVVAVFIRQGQHNHAFDPLWERLPDRERPNQLAEVKFDTLKLLPKNRRYYAYDGSFTTPPCTEQVKWVVLATPVSMSKQQLERLRQVIGRNNRPVQPLNGRPVFRSR